MSNRYDTVDIETMTTKFTKTPEGYLTGRAIVCSTGVYQYMDAEGNTHGELRLPEEVFATPFLDSLKLKPLTFLHPTEMVTAENVKQYQVGTLGNNPSSPAGLEKKGDNGEQIGFQFFNTDMYNVSIDLTVHDAEAVSEVESGIRELSVGYSCDLEDASGVWCGMKYDKIQRNLRANHVSIVPKARGGDALRIRLDSADAAVLIKDSDKEATMPELKDIKLDGVEYKAEAKVLETLNNSNLRADGLQVKLDALTADKSKVEADRDNLKDKCDGLEKKIVELEKSRVDEAMIQAAVEKRVKILDAAKAAGVEVKDGMGDLDIQKAVIAKVFPKANLDGKDQVYVDARFDGALESLDGEANADAETRQVGAAETVNTDAAKDEDVVAKARAKYEASIAGAYIVKGKE